MGRDELIRILTEPKNALTKHYNKLMEYDGVTLEFHQEALEAVADQAIEREIGARGLRAVLEGIMTETMYEVPSDPTIDTVLITAATVRGEEAPLVHRDPEKQRISARIPERSGKEDRPLPPQNVS